MQSLFVGHVLLVLHDQDVSLLVLQFFILFLLSVFQSFIKLLGLVVHYLQLLIDVLLGLSVLLL